MVAPRFGAFVSSILRRLSPNYSQAGQGPEHARQFCNQLVDLGFSEVLEDAISSVAFDSMDTLVEEKTARNLTERALPDLVQWMHKFIEEWMAPILPSATSEYDTVAITNLYARSKRDRDFCTPQLMHWRKRLFFRLHESVGQIRKAQLMTIVESFPRSLPAVEDLKDCILSTDQKPELTIALREQFVQTMLNVGTITSEILQQYVNVIRMLRFLDPSGVMLENVSEPVREYLRKRPDTVRCIVSGMTGDGELYEELQRGRVKRDRDSEGDVYMSGNGPLDRKIHDEEDEDCQSIDGYYNANMQIDLDEYVSWEPEPIDAPRKGGKWRPGKDAIATLVTIYGTSEQIVNEYKGLLADKLVTSFDLDLEREYKTLELLTERFGKEAMHDCLIMLNDIKGSETVLKTAQSKPLRCGKLDNFEAVVISKEFWPKLQEESEFRTTSVIGAQMEMYGASFKEQKHPRMLRWQHGVGSVSVNLEFEDGRKIEANVTPIQATILSHFAQSKKQTVAELQDLLGIGDEAFFRRKIQGLANLGFIKAADANNSTYETVEFAADVDSASGIDDDAAQNNEEEVDDDIPEDSQMSVYETYVMAMLQNLKQLPLDQIHNMLQRFVQTPAYDKTEAQLAAFLTQLVEQGKIELSAGLYRVQSKKTA
ncbi:Cullin [Gracilaria domingensis]|nr:Cullin [Gracilaria domingensis]